MVTREVNQVLVLLLAHTPQSAALPNPPQGNAVGTLYYCCLCACWCFGVAALMMFDSNRSMSIAFFIIAGASGVLGIGMAYVVVADISRKTKKLLKLLHRLAWRSTWNTALSYGVALWRNAFRSDFQRLAL